MSGGSGVPAGDFADPTAQREIGLRGLQPILHGPSNAPARSASGAAAESASGAAAWSASGAAAGLASAWPPGRATARPAGIRTRFPASIREESTESQEPRVDQEDLHPPRA